MKTSRRFAIVVMVSMLFLPALVTAQEATPAAGGIERDVVFEITVPANAVPPGLKHLHFFRLSMAPQTDVALGGIYQGLAGRGLSVETGELVITPSVDAWVWRGDSASGTTATPVAMGEPVWLTTGDTILIPGTAEIQDASIDEARIANPGTEAALVIGFQLCAGSHFYPPEITSLWDINSLSGRDEVNLMREGEIVVRLTRYTAQPGVLVPYATDALFAIYEVDQGTVDHAVTAVVNDAWGAGEGGVSRANSTPPHMMVVTGEVPAVAVELVVMLMKVSPQTEAVGTPSA